eukprot:scaffold3384_cov122-Skeletonema_marinoi.AAC.1
MTTLATKYERMRSIPRFDVDEHNGDCVWCPIERNFVDGCICVDPIYDQCGEDDEKLVLERAHSYISQILAAHDESGQEMPLWRVIILSSKVALFRIDHCICDGVSAVSLLRDVGVKTSSNSKEPLSLEDLSPILRYFVRAGELRIRMLPLKLLCWPPNLIRAVKFLVNCFTLPYEVPNPLRPLAEHFGKPIPSDSIGTVYFPTMKVKLFQDMAKNSVGSSTTINDILLLCISIAFGSYFDLLGIRRSDVGGVRLLLPIANPIPLSLYNDGEYGLRNNTTAVFVPLKFPSLKFPSEEYTSMDALKDIQSYMTKVKQSNAPLLMSCVNRFLQPLVPVEKIAEKGIEVFQRASCVWSNIPGPVEAVSFFSPISGNMYNIKKMQIVIPHPISFLQVTSYDGNLFFNITLDLRSAKNPGLLREAFVNAVKSVAEATGVDKEQRWAEELKKYSESNEWGGDDVVYSCA